MTVTHNTRRITLMIVLTLALAAFVAPAAALSAPSETQQGAQVLSEVQAGKLKGKGLNDTQYERVGQYLMSRALGSTQRYEAMDSVMDRMMGQSTADQMYLYMGERYLGKNVAPNGNYKNFYGWMANMMSHYSGAYAGMMGGYMMGAYRSLSGQGGYSGMMGGTGLGTGMMGSAYNATSSSSGWSTGEIVAVSVIGAALLAVGLAFAVPKLRHRRQSGPASPAAEQS